MIGAWSERFARIEYALVCALALVLPTLESPKNLAVFLLLLTWVVHRIVARDVVLRRPDWVEASLLFILAACILSTVFNWPLVNGLKGLKDTLVQVFVFWLIYRAGYSERQYLIIAAMVAVGVLIGLGWVSSRSPRVAGDSCSFTPRVLSLNRRFISVLHWPRHSPWPGPDR